MYNHSHVHTGPFRSLVTKHEDMIDIMSALQHCAPKVSYTTDEQIMSTGEDTTVSTCTTCVTLTINIYSRHVIIVPGHPCSCM